MAEEEGDLVAIEAEITKHEDFGHRMAALARRALFSVAPSARWKERGRLAADSGNLADDLTDVFVALGQAAEEHDKGEADAIDEILAYTEGYPYFTQEYGSVVWNFAAWTPPHGYAAFTVPPFDRYMKRAYELGFSH